MKSGDMLGLHWEKQLVDGRVQEGMKWRETGTRH